MSRFFVNHPELKNNDLVHDVINEGNVDQKKGLW
jgi:hypothetical protein